MPGTVRGGLVAAIGPIWDQRRPAVAARWPSRTVGRMNDEPLVTLQAAAEYLNVSTRTVRRLVATGDLDCRRVGRQLRFEAPVLRCFKSRPLERTPAAAAAFDAGLAALTYDSV